MTKVLALGSYGAGQWKAEGQGPQLVSAIDGSPVANMPGLANVEEMIDYARTVGGPSLRAISFQQRGKMLRALAGALSERKEELYALSSHTGATRSDSAFDIEGGIGALFVYASKAKSLADARCLLDGERELISKGDFIGQHILAPLTGVAIHINAYNFPVWGMLEKLATTLLAGMPAIVKPATDSGYLTEAAFRIMIESGIAPDGSIQLLMGETGPLLDLLGGQDSVAFTGSAATANKLKSLPNIVQNTVRFAAEQDSLNASILGADVRPEDPEFSLFVKEVAREITQKAGQKCTAIRRILVPSSIIDEIQDALIDRLSNMTIGDPRSENTRLGALAGTRQREDVMSKLELLRTQAELVLGGKTPQLSSELNKGAFFEASLLRCDTPLSAGLVHSVEAFGPVATLMPYTDLDNAAYIANAGQGSLALSIFSHNPETVVELVHATSPFHGRILVIDRDNAEFSTGHGAALPHLQHGGPGRAGGGAELGGLSGLTPYLQRSAIQASDHILNSIARR